MPARTLTRTWPSEGHEAAALSPDGRLLATTTSTDNDIRLWIVGAGKE
jgi:hypothetical protein